MEITNLQLTDYRNFTSRKIDFSNTTTVILGENAAGKTNILEAVYLLATGKSFKAKVEEEMIGYEADIARVKGEISTKSRKSETDNVFQSIDIEAVLTRGELNKVRVPKKKLIINGISKRSIDFIGNLKAVIFGPWDMDLVTESPSIRRNFLDSVLYQTDREYRRALMSYEKGLRQRNRLLFRIREEGLPRSQLLFWNTLLIKNGDFVTKKREEFIDFVNSSNSQLTINYQIEYDKSIISELRLEQYKDAEIGAATTLVGPHRDDFIFKILNPKSEVRSLSSFGSRGEQRIGVLWVKMAELAYIEECTGEKPILLLDDIFSELDHEHRDLVFDIAKGQQTIITTADPHFVENINKSLVIEI